MKSKQLLLLISGWLIAGSLFAQLTAVPTFESCGYSMPFSSETDNKVFFKEAGESTWHEGFPAVYDATNKEFRGSIVRLLENTNYNLRFELWNKGVKKQEYTVNFKTWNSYPTISKTVNISTFKSKNYVIDKQVGSESGWIKIVGDATVDRAATTDEHAVLLTNCKYVILEGVKVTGGGKNAIRIDRTSSDIRIINCDISKWGRTSVKQTSAGVYVDATGEEINYDAGVSIYRCGNVVIERCYIHDSKARANAWKGKIKVGDYKDKEYSNTHPKGPTGIFAGMTTGGIVIRWNDVIGNQEGRFNDVIESTENGNVAGGFNKNSDIYGNMLAFGQDDGIELDGGQMNVRMFDNRIEQTYDGISTAPNMKGPSYIFNNVIWNLGDEEKNETVGVKNGGGRTWALGRIFFFNNTIYTSKNCISGVGYGASDLADRAGFSATTRNNILVSGRTPVQASATSGGDGLSISDRMKWADNDFDYDLLGNSKSTGAGTIYTSAGQEAHGVYAFPELEDVSHAVFTLKNTTTNKAINTGIEIPNFNDEYHGSKPDMGALEYCSSSLIPMRPLNMIADQYAVKLNPGGSAQTVTIFVGDISEDMPFTICKSADMTWLTATASTATAKANTEITLTLKASSTSLSYRKIGMVIVRMNNGLSIPISVLAE
ncbi:hypothetical protein FACS189413_09010 [Bacteroidia bacterium]|nr:hypothetical protein FACS189413_09010 [Bacteroidia bacterium]